MGANSSKRSLKKRPNYRSERRTYFIKRNGHATSKKCLSYCLILVFLGRTLLGNRHLIFSAGQVLPTQEQISQQISYHINDSKLDRTRPISCAVRPEKNGKPSTRLPNFSVTGNSPLEQFSNAGSRWQPLLHHWRTSMPCAFIKVIASSRLPSGSKILNVDFAKVASEPGAIRYQSAEPSKSTEQSIFWRPFFPIDPVRATLTILLSIDHGSPLRLPLNPKFVGNSSCPVHLQI